MGLLAGMIDSLGCAQYLGFVERHALGLLRYEAFHLIVEVFATRFGAGTVAIDAFNLGQTSLAKSRKSNVTVATGNLAATIGGGCGPHGGKHIGHTPYR